MVYERVRGWTSGRSLRVQNVVKYPPPPTGSACTAPRRLWSQDIKCHVIYQRVTRCSAHDVLFRQFTNCNPRRYAVYELKTCHLISLFSFILKTQENGRQRLFERSENTLSLVWRTWTNYEQQVHSPSRASPQNEPHFKVYLEGPSFKGCVLWEEIRLRTFTAACTRDNIN